MSVEKILEARLKRDVKKRGGYCIKILPFAETGLPDELAILPNGVSIWVEVKSSATLARLKKNGRLTKQGVWRNRLLNLGQEHFVIFDEKSYNCLLKRMDLLCLI